MKEYLISLGFITSPSVSASELSKLIGVDESALTYRTRVSSSDHSEWRFDPTMDEDIELTTGIELLSSSIKSQRTVNLDETIKDIYLTIGVLNSSYTCTTNLSFSSLAPLISKFPDLIVQVVTYPSNFEDYEY